MRFNSFKPTIFSVVLWAGVLLRHTTLSAADRDVQLTQSNAQQTTLVYRLTDFQLRPLLVNGEAAARPDFANAVTLNIAGAPELAARVFVFGVPPGARAEVSVIPGTSEEFSGVNIPPVPIKEKADDLTRLRYAPDAQIYERATFYPGDLFKVDAPAQIRQQTIVRVEVFPVQYHPVRKQLRIYREMQIVVRFIGGLPAAAPALATNAPVSLREEELYQNLLVNYEQAKTFRLPAPSPLLKTTNPQIDGPLYKFPVRQEGIYKIDGRTLASAGITNINSNTIHLYNNGGRELPREVTRSRPQGLVENAIYVSDGGDGRLDSDDFILFYARGVDGFAFDSTSGQARHYLNRFGFDNYYWLNFNGPNGLRMPERATLPVANLIPAVDFKDYLFVEEELNPLYESDQSWYGWLFTSSEVNRSRRYRFKLTDPVSEGTASTRFAFYATFAGGFNTHNLKVEYDKQELANLQIPGNNRPDFYQVDKLGGLANGDNEILLTYQSGSDAAQLYIDYFEVAYDRRTRLNEGALIFNGRAGNGPFAYTVDNADANSLWLFDVSNFSNVTRLPAQNWRVNGTQMTFADIAGTVRVPRRYLAALPSAFKSISAQTIVRDEVSTWRSPNHAADMIIITHEDFLAASPGKSKPPLTELAELRLRPANLSDSLRSVTVKIQDVFDEFSGGLYDPTAVRDFLKYAYDNWRRRPLFVLLVGDGDYDPKNYINKTDKNWIPTFHTTELDEIASRVTDSWFTYVAGNDDVMDLAIGRIPARSLAEVQAYVDKLIQYETKPTFGSWRNTAVMVADDEFGQGAIPSSIETVHILDTETLASVFYTPQYLDVKKLYLTEFAAVQSASISGIRKPTATDALLRLVNNGALLVNYAGHGNSEVWAHERALNLSTDLDRIQNGEKQALWIAATCTFGKYDIPDKQSFAEQLVLTPGRGAIAVLATARDVYASQNATLNQQYYRFFFENANHISARIGMAMVLARLQTGATQNDEKFHVLGDPSLRIGIPRYTASLTSVQPDTIKALTVMTVSGKVKRDNGQDWPDFNGTVRVETLDAQRDVSYLSPGQFSLNYGLPGNSLFRGEAPVKNGTFTVQFFVPKDITYGGVSGRINLYFWDKDNKFDGNGYRQQLRVGGTAGNIADRIGPTIRIGFEGVENFNSGDVVGDQPVLRAAISDSLSGVNITGEIGHKLTLALDGRTDEKIDITDLFNYDSGSYTRGTALYPLGSLAEGRHTVEIKAWDNLNNSNSATMEFVVRPKNQLVLSDVLNYPNPFRNRTSFTFELNFADTEVRIKIFTLAGRLIRTLESAGGRGFNQIDWDGRDEDGDPLANGVYLYKIIATQNLGGEALRAEEIGKLVVQR